MSDEVRMDQIVRLLEQNFMLNQSRSLSDPFQVLIATVLSQNTSDRNSHRAFLRLRERFDVRPEVLASLKPEDIKPAIKCAGLSEIKSRRIVEISRELLKRFDGDLSRVFRLPLNKAREVLMGIRLSLIHI